MRLAIAALTVALLLAGAESRAQDAAGAVENKATAAEAGSATAAPTAPAETRPRPGLILDLLEELVRPRPAPIGNVAVPAPVGTATPAPVSTAPAPAPAGPAAAPTVVPPKADPAPAPPRPSPATAPAPSEATVTAPPAQSASTQPAATRNPAPQPIPAEPSPEPSPALPGPTGWALLGLAAAALAGSMARLRRTRRIARTRAAVALAPRLDIWAGAGSLGGLTLAAPPLAIRARLDPSGARLG